MIYSDQFTECHLLVGYVFTDSWSSVEDSAVSREAEDSTRGFLSSAPCDVSGTTCTVLSSLRIWNPRVVPLALKSFLVIVIWMNSISLQSKTSVSWQIISYNTKAQVGARIGSWLRQCATSWKTAGSIPDEGIGILHWINPSDRTVALESAQDLTFWRRNYFFNFSTPCI